MRRRLRWIRSAWPGLGVITAALALVVQHAAPGPAAPAPQPCTRAMMIDGQLRCDDELPVQVEALCPSPGPVATRAPAAGDAFDTAQLCSHSQGAHSRVTPYEPASGWSRMSPDDLAALHQSVDVNEATAHELQSLPRIGPALAQRIVKGRPYAAIDELQRVRGIGPATMERMRSRVVVTPRAP